MTTIGRRAISAIIFMFVFSSSAFGADVDPALVKKLRKEICADPSDPTKSIIPPTAPATKLEANACTDCEIKSAVAATKLTEVESATAPVVKVLDEAIEKERVRRELAYFRLATHAKDTEDPETLRLEQDYAKGKIQKLSEEKEKSLSTSSDLKALVENPTGSKEKLVKILQESLPFLADEIKQKAEHIDYLKKQIQKHENSGSSSVIAKTAKSVPQLKEALKQHEKIHGEKQAMAEASRELLHWATQPSTALPPSTSIDKATEWLKDRLVYHERQLQKIELDITAYEKKIELAEQKLKKAESNKTAASSESNYADDLEELKTYESKLAGELVANSNGVSETCGMSIAEQHAISNYTGEGYSDLNDSIRAGGESREEFKPFEDVLKSALGKIRSYEGPVKRGAELPAEVLAKHTIGKVVTYAAFTSSSLGSGFDRKHRFVIKSKTGKYIAPFSVNEYEQEVLFKPGTEFKILDRQKKGESIEFVMEEVTDETDAK